MMITHLMQKWTLNLSSIRLSEKLQECISLCGILGMVKATNICMIESKKDTSGRGITYSNFSSPTIPRMRRFPCQFTFVTLTVLVCQYTGCYTTLACTCCIKRQSESSVSEGQEDKSASPNSGVWNNSLEQEGQALPHQPCLTLACRRPPIASAPASLRLSAAPEAWRSALYTSWGQSPVLISLLHSTLHY